MRANWFTASVLVVGLLVVSSPASFAGTPVSPAKQLALFKVLDGPFSKADNKWTDTLSSLTSKATVAQVSKPSLAFVPALKAFDSGLQRIGFTGNTAVEAADVVKLNGKLITILRSIKSLGSFQAQVSALFSKYGPVQNALAKDFGIAAGDVVI
jgi:hypothetical protein